jgi:hypothetical protein
MITLEKEFSGRGEVSGVLFKQIKKTDKAYMYELTEPITGQKRYEVFKKKASKSKTAILGANVVQFDEKELYPNAKNFGSWAWCSYSYQKALIKFDSINI